MPLGLGPQKISPIVSKSPRGPKKTQVLTLSFLTRVEELMACLGGGHRKSASLEPSKHLEETTVERDFLPRGRTTHRDSKGQDDRTAQKYCESEGAEVSLTASAQVPRISEHMPAHLSSSAANLVGHAGDYGTTAAAAKRGYHHRPNLKCHQH